LKTMVESISEAQSNPQSDVGPTTLWLSAQA
jgi:hypothetical protein